MSIQTNIESIRENVKEALSRSENPNREVVVIAVSKTVGFDEVRTAIESGITDFGENRVDELLRKQQEFPEVNWHFIGRIQTNKIKKIVGNAKLIHSVSSVRVLEAINEEAIKKEIQQSVLLQVNISGESTKDGFLAEELSNVLELLVEFKGVVVEGLMTMAPKEDLEEARRDFAELKLLEDSLKVYNSTSAGINFSELSMGMSQDYLIAVEAGATMIRVGSSIFR